MRCTAIQFSHVFAKILQLFPRIRSIEPSAASWLVLNISVLASCLVFNDETVSTMSAFLSSDKRDVGSNEDLLEDSEGSGFGSGNGGISEGFVSHQGGHVS